MIKFVSFKDEYTKVMADAITVSIDDLSPTEQGIIDKGYEMFMDKLEDIKIANDEIKRLSIELANLRAMYIEDTRPSTFKSTDDEDMD
jgi:hypothetical protein